MESIYKVGKTYQIRLNSGDWYDDCKITKVDDQFISFFYTFRGILKEKILRLDSIWMANEYAQGDLKTYWYYAKVMSDRYGIDTLQLSPAEVLANEEAGVKLFTNEGTAKEYLFNIAFQGKYEGQYLSWEGEPCALYRSTSNNEWDGVLAEEYLKWCKNRKEAKNEA